MENHLITFRYVATITKINNKIFFYSLLLDILNNSIKTFLVEQSLALS